MERERAGEWGEKGEQDQRTEPRARSQESYVQALTDTFLFSFLIFLSLMCCGFFVVYLFCFHFVPGYCFPLINGVYIVFAICPST